MFYVAEALLAERGLRFRKHGGVHATFGEEFVKSGELDTKYHRWLLDAFDLRIQADYGIEAQATHEEVEEMVERARMFLRETRAYLERP